RRPAWLQHAKNLPRGGIVVRQVLQHLAADDVVERGVLERQVRRVSLHDRQSRIVTERLAGLADAFFLVFQPDDLRLRQVPQDAQDETVAAAAIENTDRLCLVDPLDDRFDAATEAQVRLGRQRGTDASPGVLRARMYPCHRPFSRWYSGSFSPR